MRFCHKWLPARANRVEMKKAEKVKLGWVPPLHWLYVQNEITLLFWGGKFSKNKFCSKACVLTTFQ